MLHLKEGVNLENIASSTGASDSIAVETFARLINIYKTQPGFIRQFWVIGLHPSCPMGRLKNHRVIKSKIITSLYGLLVGHF